MKDFENALVGYLSAANSLPDADTKVDYSAFTDFSDIAETEECVLSEKFGGRAALALRLLAAIASRRGTEHFKFGKPHTREEICDYILSLYFNVSVETVYLLTLDRQDRFISCEFVTEGTVNSSEVVPRRLVELMIRAKAKKGILVHNHPRGYSEASVNDATSTYRIRELFESADLELIDHYVVGDGTAKTVPV